MQVFKTNWYPSEVKPSDEVPKIVMLKGGSLLAVDRFVDGEWFKYEVKKWCEFPSISNYEANWQKLDALSKHAKGTKDKYLLVLTTDGNIKIAQFGRNGIYFSGKEIEFDTQMMRNVLLAWLPIEFTDRTQMELMSTFDTKLALRNLDTKVELDTLTLSAQLNHPPKNPGKLKELAKTFGYELSLEEIFRKNEEQ